jgi:hypothetical protein
MAFSSPTSILLKVVGRSRSDTLRRSIDDWTAPAATIKPQIWAPRRPTRAKFGRIGIAESDPVNIPVKDCISRSTIVSHLLSFSPGRGAFPGDQLRPTPMSDHPPRGTTRGGETTMRMFPFPQVRCTPPIASLACMRYLKISVHSTIS